jgi:type I restriction enzyme S subunit
MEVMPGYKKTDVGVIPADWDAGGLGRFWSVTDCKHVTAEFVPDGIPIASIREVQSRFVDLRHAKQTTAHFYELLIEGGRKPRPGDLILSRNATVGEVAQVTELHPPFAMGQDVCLLRKKSGDHSTEFLQALFESPVILNQLANLMVGSTFKRANVEQIRNFAVPMPPPPEQRAIAAALSDADALLTGLDRLITKKRNLKQAAMQHLLSGQTRLPGFQGAWEVKRLGELLTILHGKNQREVEVSGGLYPILATGGQIGTASRALYDKPSVLIGRKGTINQPRYMETPFWTVDTLFYSAMKADSNAKFLYYRFCLIDWMQYNEASGVPSLNARTIENVEVSVPTLAEQSSIAATLSDMDAELNTLEARRSKTRALKQGMMQELLTGRTRLA